MYCLLNTTNTTTTTTQIRSNQLPIQCCSWHLNVHARLNMTLVDAGDVVPQLPPSIHRAQLSLTVANMRLLQTFQTICLGSRHPTWL